MTSSQEFVVRKEAEEDTVPPAIRYLHPLHAPFTKQIYLGSGNRGNRSGYDITSGNVMDSPSTSIDSTMVGPFFYVCSCLSRGKAYPNIHIKKTKKKSPLQKHTQKKSLLSHDHHALQGGSVPFSSPEPSAPHLHHHHDVPPVPEPDAPLPYSDHRFHPLSSPTVTSPSSQASAAAIDPGHQDPQRLQQGEHSHEHWRIIQDPTLQTELTRPILENNPAPQPINTFPFDQASALARQRKMEEKAKVFEADRQVGVDVVL